MFCDSQTSAKHLHSHGFKKRTVSTSGLKLVKYNETVFCKGAGSVNIEKKNIY